MKGVQGERETRTGKGNEKGETNVRRIGNSLNVRCEIQNEVKNDFEISFWVTGRLEI